MENILPQTDTRMREAGVMDSSTAKANRSMKTEELMMDSLLMAKKMAGANY